ncbi:MAG: nucleoside 2-deoxyribosyltransferase [Bacteroidota bacterium]
MKNRSIIENSRVYLSGPMDFVASREEEKEYGWRSKIKSYLESNGVTVFDPWEKPEIRGIHEYGKEDTATINIRNEWSFGNDKMSSEARSNCVEQFSKTVHIDLRMVDISDFVIAYCPTNIYSVGTVHEIVVARQQRKPVLFVSPKVSFPSFDKLVKRAEKEPELKLLSEELEREIPIKSNEKGIPSLWYMSVVGSENFFDGFGFMLDKYTGSFNDANRSRLDEMEAMHPPEKPLLKFLEDLSHGIMPKKWNSITKQYEIDEDWLIMEKL